MVPKSTEQTSPQPPVTQPSSAKGWSLLSVSYSNVVEPCIELRRKSVCNVASVSAFNQIPSAVSLMDFFQVVICVWRSCLASMYSLIPAFLKYIILLILVGFMGSLSTG